MNEYEKSFPIKGYEKLYSITKDGKIWSHISNKWMNTTLDSNGYYRIGLRKNGKHKNLKIHRLVAETFIPNPENKPQINHKNGIKTDNRIINLEWVTAQENIHHAIEIGLVDQIGENNPNSKITQLQVFEIRENHLKHAHGEQIWKKYGISESQYNAIIRNEYWHDSNYTYIHKNNCNIKKLNWKQIHEMRENHLNYKNKQTWKQYKISKEHYNRIINNTSWYNANYISPKQK